PLGLAAGAPRVRRPDHRGVDPAQDFPDAVGMRMYPRLLPLLLALLCAGPASGGQQDEDYNQKNTALLNWYPEEGEIVTRASALAAAGKYVEALGIYDDALKNRPTTVVTVDKSRTYGLRE